MRNRAAVLFLLFALAPYLSARDFRAFQRIPTPSKLPEGAVPVKEVKPVPVNEVKGAVQELMASWNTQDVADKLGEKFYDKERLLDSISEKVPKDATVRVLGLRNVQVLQQYEKPSSSGNRPPEITSIVSVTAQTQIEFNDPTRGFQRVDGVNEFIFEVTATRPD